ncbi:hypothetical protein [Streptomyces lomondensis]|uniref:Uncharacterized protein n=1 Tax=Streptomyces lomondensis TaxID=68229 RepID=A0ABQ2X3F8_9ACTN|nr:hypothetical protein [Streptomyces lomondensis]MCF0079975.1 hypothetical protein [Streptomyces lomondensis]GGW97029.1 hypothetical protein GCM10010383_28540 [Streptomyces lomondensis]
MAVALPAHDGQDGSINGQQTGDPAKLARALLTIAARDQPPPRFIAGADAIEGISAKARELLAQAEASRALPGRSWVQRRPS